MIRLLAAAGLALMLGATGAGAASVADVNASIDSLLGNHQIYETTVTTFQQAVKSGHKADVAAFVRYPIRVEIGGHKRTIRSSKAFIRHYNDVMTPDIVDAVVEQKYEDLFVNSHGIMFGDGQVWIKGICLDRSCKRFVPKIVSIQHTGHP